MLSFFIIVAIILVVLYIMRDRLRSFGGETVVESRGATSSECVRPPRAPAYERPVRRPSRAAW